MEYRVLLRATYRFGSFSSPRAILSALLLAWMAHVNPCDAQTCGQLSGVNFTENFNSLPASGTGLALPLPTSGFTFVESPGNFTYSADNGSNTLADTYSYGSNGSSDRALGELTSGTVSSRIGACFVNNTNHAITSLVIGYTGEEWRLGVADGT